MAGGEEKQTLKSRDLSHGLISFPDCQKQLGIFQG